MSIFLSEVSEVSEDEESFQRRIFQNSSVPAALERARGRIGDVAAAARERGGRKDAAHNDWSRGDGR